MAAVPAAAQLHPGIGAPAERALHVRLGDASVVAIATVDAVLPGRIRVVSAEILAGAAPPAFEIKRSPTRPPALAPGDRAVLLLDGARSPYVLVDGPSGALAIEGEAAGARWSAALRSLSDARADPAVLLERYLEFVMGDAEDLRQQGWIALSGPETPVQPLPREVATSLARDALDPGAHSERRRVSARLAARHPDGLRTLLAGIARGAGGNAEVEAEVARLALRTGLALRLPEAPAALERAIQSGQPALREVAERLATRRARSAPGSRRDRNGAARADAAASEPDR